MRDADAIVGWELPSHLLQAATRLRWMHASGAGVERYDLAQIAARGVMLTNSSGVSAPNMAEHVLGMMIALTRRFRLLRAQTSENGETRQRTARSESSRGRPSWSSVSARSATP